MPRPQSRDEQIARKAGEFADQVRKAAALAANEAEVRIEVERQLALLQADVPDLKLERGRHEFTLASGRVDSVYDRVIIEYKNPSDPAARLGPRLDSPGSVKVIDQIKKRFYDMRTVHKQPLNTLFGVGCDGNHFIFVRFRDDKWQSPLLLEVNQHSSERFLWALVNLGTKGKPREQRHAFVTDCGRIAVGAPRTLHSPRTCDTGRTLVTITEHEGFGEYAKGYEGVAGAIPPSELAVTGARV